MFSRFCALFVLACSCSAVNAAVNTDIRITLEEPVSNARYASISNLRGWAVAENSISKLELYVDGNFVSDIPYGGLRTDVGSAFPNYPNSDASGFSMAYNYKSLSPGQHEIAVRAIDSNGDHNEVSTAFTTTRFGTAFINDPSVIDLSTADNFTVLNDRTLRIRGMEAEGQHWDVTLSWDTASQSFKLATVEARNAPLIRAAVDGKWEFENYEDEFKDVRMEYDAGNDEISVWFEYIQPRVHSRFLSEDEPTANTMTMEVSTRDLSMRARLTIESSSTASLIIDACHSSKSTSPCFFKAGEKLRLRKIF